MKKKLPLNPAQKQAKLLLVRQHRSMKSGNSRVWVPTAAAADAALSSVVQSGFDQ